MNSKTIIAESANIAYCGLYCGACGKFLKDKCPGCAKNEKASWCGVRKCCMEHNYISCADCTTYGDPVECKAFHNPISRVFGFLFRSDRRGCINYIKKNGYDDYAAKMTSEGRMAMKR